MAVNCRYRQSRDFDRRPTEFVRPYLTGLTAICRSARVLDCFAGSGALGFEAASRGAKSLTLIERNEQAWRNLKSQAQRLGAGNMQLLHGDAITLIPELTNVYDVVFVDPPYALTEIRNRVIELLITSQKLAVGAKIYLEWPKGEQFDLLHPGLSWWKQKKAGQVNYAIAEWRPSR